MAFWTKLIASAAIMMTAISAQGQDNLFEEIPLSEQMSDPAPNESGLVHRHVKLNAKLATAIFRSGQPSEYLVFDLMPGKTVTFRNAMIDKNMGGRITVWSGRAQGLEDGSATLVYRRGRILGHVQVGADTFRIQPGRNGVHTISLLDLSGLPNEGDDAIQVPENR